VNHHTRVSEIARLIRNVKNKYLCLLAAGLDAVNPLFLLCLQVTELVEEDESWADMEFILDKFIPPGPVFHQHTTLLTIRDLLALSKTKERLV
jgi:hypothetical protein